MSFIDQFYWVCIYVYMVIDADTIKFAGLCDICLLMLMVL